MFSVIIPLYNKTDFILRAMKSVINQSFSEWEVIVVDDGSTDDSYEKIIPFLSEKINVIQQENKGVSEARNLGISMAKFEYIAFLDADDYWHEDYLFHMSKGVEKFPKAGIWGTRFVTEKKELYNNTSDFYEIENYFRNAFNEKYFLTSSTVLRKKFFLLNRGFKKNLTKGEDLDVWFRAICFFGKPVFSDNPLVFYERAENINSLTKIKYPISKSIHSDICRKDYLRISNLDIISSNEFEKFKVRYIYFGVMSFFRPSENPDNIRKIIAQLNEKLILMYLFYKLPDNFLIWFFSSPKRKRWFKKINKFFYIS